MTKELAINVTNLNKSFHIREKGTRTIRNTIIRFYQQRGEKRIIKALIDINFSVYKGEILGIIGNNGSGKSTLLKLLIGSFKPDKGSAIETKGRIIRLAMGLGFDNNLSARDNIYINGSILGMNFRKIGTVFHEIIKFADLEEFIDTPIKHYSNGMKAKLKFSIARYAEADILLMDEIIGGVGDLSFIKKSQIIFEESILSKKTIIIVSHNLNFIKKYCNRVMLLHKGKQIKIGQPESIIRNYKSIMGQDSKHKGTNKESIRIQNIKNDFKVRIENLKKTIQKKDILIMRKNTQINKLRSNLDSAKKSTYKSNY